MIGIFFIGKQKGSVLITGLLFLALISIIATTAYVLSITDVSISENYKYEEQAFNNAEAGIQFGFAKLKSALKSGAIIPGSGTMEIPGASTAPPGFSFTLSPLTVKEDVFNSYTFSVMGTGSKNASAHIRVGIKRLPAIGYGAFANQNLDSKSNACYYSYDSRTVANPTAIDSTGQCDVGSNQKISLKNNTFIDGDVALGSNGVSDAAYTVSGTQIVSGDNGVFTGWIDPDPLNVDSGSFQLEFDTAMGDNDNMAIIPTPGGVKIINPGGVVTFPSKSDGSTYYLEEITLFNSDTLVINAENGPVTIYLKGILTTQIGSKINIINTGIEKDVTIKITEDPLFPLSGSQRIIDLHNSSGLNEANLPTGFSILTDSDAILDFNNSSDVSGLVYAPNGNVIMHNDNGVYGAVWANTLDGKNGFVLYFDIALMDKYLSNKIGMTSWEKVLN